MLKNLYFLGIIPPAEIASEITKMKHFCADQFNTVHALNSPPHITIAAPFKTDPQGEKTLMELLQKESKTVKPFYIELNGFDHFSKRVVFVSAKPNPALTLAQIKFSQIISSVVPPESPRESGFHPHMTIAFRDVQPKQFDGIWSHFKGRDFNRIFQCRAITLLKYTDHKWIPFRTIAFA